jgi:hypothetical protein
MPWCRLSSSRDDIRSKAQAQGLRVLLFDFYALLNNRAQIATIA